MPLGRDMGALEYFLKTNCDIEAQSIRHYNSQPKYKDTYASENLLLYLTPNRRSALGTPFNMQSVSIIQTRHYLPV